MNALVRIIPFACSLAAAGTSLGATPDSRDILESANTQAAQVQAALDFCKRDATPVVRALDGLIGAAGLSLPQRDHLRRAYEQAKRDETARIAGIASQKGFAQGACPAATLDTLDKQTPVIVKSLDDMRRGWRQTAAPAPAPVQAADIAPGKYTCYTFDAGQLNYAYTDVVVQKSGQYAVGAKGGSYQLKDGRVSFTGPLSNATGRYAVKQTGVPQLDLVFNGDNRASMTCPRGR
ncbi:hypothetical protein WKR98_21540 [Pigmentiphaga sp. YJ18]|uniref:hypothetical protein n=1 Tax=Pigmentiphaga sp. YJ18 TaxID=3134907 RepID=UPI0031159B63